MDDERSSPERVRVRQSPGPSQTRRGQAHMGRLERGEDSGQRRRFGGGWGRDSGQPAATRMESWTWSSAQMTSAVLKPPWAMSGQRWSPQWGALFWCGGPGCGQRPQWGGAGSQHGLQQAGWMQQAGGPSIGRGNALYKGQRFPRCCNCSLWYHGDTCAAPRAGQRFCFDCGTVGVTRRECEACGGVPRQ